MNFLKFVLHEFWPIVVMLVIAVAFLAAALYSDASNQRQCNQLGGTYYQGQCLDIRTIPLRR